MISRFQITGGGGGADSVISEYSGGDDSYGIMSVLSNPVVLVGGAIAAYMTFGDN